MPQTLTKRTYDDRLFDVDCTDLLEDDEQIVTPLAPISDRDVGLEFGPVVVNTAPITYAQLGRTADVGKALQVRIHQGYLYKKCEQIVTLRFRFSTNINAQLEATVVLRISDQP